MTKTEAAIRLADAALAYREAEIREYDDDILSDCRQNLEGAVEEYRKCPTMEGLGSWCSQCGFDVRVDEDGCCVHCGSDATGYGADEAIKYRMKALCHIPDEVIE